MLNLMRSEWLKLWRRPMALIVLIIFLALLLLSMLATFLAIGLHDGSLIGGYGEIQFLSDEQMEIYRLQMSFPGIFATVLSQANGTGGILAIILAAGVFGSEYGWGTIRVHLARYPNRGNYLIAKSVVLLFGLFVGITIAMVIGCIVGAIFASILGQVGSIELAHVWLVPFGMLRALYVMLPYVMFTIAITTIGRSVLAGVAGGMIFLILDLGMGTLSFLSQTGGWLAFLYNLSLQQNINTLVVLNSQMFGVDTSLLVAGLDLERLPNPSQAMILVGLYSIIFFGYAYYWLIRADITGAQ